MSKTGIQQLKTVCEINSEKKDWVNKDLYRLLYKPDLYVQAYESIKSNPGNMTAGSDGETMDGFSLSVIRGIIEDLRTQKYRFKPARRVEIPKKNGKKRPIGIASTRDKIVQEVIKMVLQAIYEPAFSDASHGFRVGRGCHSALEKFRQEWSGVNWIIEGDIKGFFDNISHKILIEILRERIKDERFLELIQKALNAGYLTFESKTVNYSLVGTPQGSGVSPILANIYLDRFDRFIEKVIEEMSKGDGKKISPHYRSISSKIYYKEKKVAKAYGQEREELIKEIKALRKTQLNTAPSENDPNFVRVKFLRYADDWIIGLNGSKETAKEIKGLCAEFLKRDLGLELSEEKTKVTHAKTEEAMFLGVRLGVGKASDQKQAKITRNGKTFKKRVTGWQPKMLIPTNELLTKLRSEGLIKGEGRPTSKAAWASMDDVQLIDRYNSIWRGYKNYYSFSDNIWDLGRIQYLLKHGLAKTLADKHKTSVCKVFKKYGKDIGVAIYKKEDDSLVRVVKFDQVKLQRNPTDFKKGAWSDFHDYTPLRKLRTTSRLLSPCCICGSYDKIEMHHVKHVRKMNHELKGFNRNMAKINRKQIPVCKPCHNSIHEGKYDGMSLKDFKIPNATRIGVTFTAE